MRYCRECLMPNTKPYISFNGDGICSACQAHQQKRQHLSGIDWVSRGKEFERLVQDAKARGAPFFDVLVPVSGGKDSITQVHRLLGYDLRILAVNVDYGIKTEVGRYNLALIPEMGANLVTYRPEQEAHRRLIRIGFEDFGDPDLLSHTLLHAYPLHMALRYKVPLVFLGENSAFEYSGESDASKEQCITRAWFSKYAANSGHDARFMSVQYGISPARLRLYDFPEELEQSETQAVFMSYYFCWDSEEHLKIALTHGFRRLDRPREGTYRDYVGIDEKINRIHQYLKVMKFGYGRATDHACEDIRNGRLTREKAKELVREYDLQELSNYYIKDFTEYLGLTLDRFRGIVDGYRNCAIWKRDDEGQWYIPGHLED